SRFCAATPHAPPAGREARHEPCLLCRGVLCRHFRHGRRPRALGVARPSRPATRAGAAGGRGRAPAFGPARRQIRRATMSAPEKEKSGGAGTRFVLAVLPLAIFIALALVFWTQLRSGRDISEIPSALIGEKAPWRDLDPLSGAQ